MTLMLTTPNSHRASRKKNPAMAKKTKSAVIIPEVGKFYITKNGNVLFCTEINSHGYASLSIIRGQGHGVPGIHGKRFGQHFFVFEGHGYDAFKDERKEFKHHPSVVAALAGMQIVREARVTVE